MIYIGTTVVGHTAYTSCRVCVCVCVCVICRVQVTAAVCCGAH